MPARSVIKPEASSSVRTFSPVKNSIKVISPVRNWTRETKTPKPPTTYVFFPLNQANMISSFKILLIKPRQVRFLLRVHVHMDKTPPEPDSREPFFHQISNQQKPRQAVWAPNIRRPSSKVRACRFAALLLIAPGTPATGIDGYRPKFVSYLLKTRHKLGVNRVKATPALAGELMAAKIFGQIAHGSPPKKRLGAGSAWHTFPASWWLDSRLAFGMDIKPPNKYSYLIWSQVN
jgi:hypothetical protein